MRQYLINLDLALYLASERAGHPPIVWHIMNYVCQPVLHSLARMCPD